MEAHRKTVVLAGRLIDGNSNVVKDNQALIIEDGKIEKIIGINQLDVSLYEKEQVIDARSKTVMPGLINGHCHLCFSGLEKPAEDIFADDNQMLIMRSQLHCQEALASGVTAVRDCGSSGSVVLKLRDAVDRDIVKGCRIISCGRPITSTGGHCWFLGGEADGVDGMRHKVREILKDGADFVKVMVSGGNMTPGSGPNIIQFGLKEMQIAADEAHMHGKHLSVHVHAAESVKDAFEAGADVFDHCSWKSGENTAYDEAYVERMVKKGVILCPALGAPYRTDPDRWFAEKPEKIEFWKVFREQRFSLTRKMIQAGMKVMGGDDAGCRMTTFRDYWKGLKLMKEQLGMSPMEVIKSATSIAADVMGVGKKIGTLKAGMAADLLIINGNPDQDLNCLETPELVMKNGAIVAEKGALIL